MNHARSGPEHKAIVGKQQLMNFQGTAVPGNVLLQPTQLISARIDKPRQFIVTLQQPTKLQTVTPWLDNFNGAVAYNPAVHQFGAPRGMQFLRCALRWGAGGVAFTTEFDYPSTGGVFGVTCDQMDLTVDTVIPLPFPQADVPVIGAWYVEGYAADPSPLRWRELSAIINAGAALSWSVKPYTRAVRLGFQNRPAAPDVTITFADVDNNTLWTERPDFTVNPLSSIVLEVPAHASVMTVASVAGAAVTIEWMAGLV